jgi:predicted alternative tryptophan synthase beta-subunit
VASDPDVPRRRLEQMLGTPAKIYYKYEGVSPAGSHKVNTSVPQAFFNKMVGITRLTTETGAGQWGSSISYAGQMFGIEVRVYMVKVSYNQKPFRRSMMQTWGAEVFASPDRHDQRRPRPRWRPTRTTPARSAWRFPRRSRKRPRARTPTTASARCSTTSACTRR